MVAANDRIAIKFKLSLKGNGTTQRKDGNYYGISTPMPCVRSVPAKSNFLPTELMKMMQLGS
jgi:hypothetical protein